MEQLPDSIKANGEVYWLLITKDLDVWTISYCVIEMAANGSHFKVNLPPLLTGEGELNQCIAGVKNKIKVLSNKQPKATK